jgi:hypothetical protein
MDFAWITNDVGDITAVNVTSPITGGGSSGAVTIGINAATTSVVGAVQLSDSTSTTSSVLASTPTATKAAYDLAASAYAPAFTNNFYAGKNKIFNGDMNIWQRGTSFTAINGYSADRWYFSSGSGRTNSRQTSALTGFTYCQRYQRDSGNAVTTALSIRQNLETINSIPFADQTVSISFYARAGANYSPTSNALVAQLKSGTGTDQNSASGFTGEVNVINQTATLTTSWQRFSYTGTVGSTATQLALVLIAIPTGTAGANDYFEVTGVQLEAGSTATPFQTASGSLGGELALCQRYYYRTTATTQYQRFTPYSPAGSTTNLYAAYFGLPVQMRVKPTSIDFSNLIWYDGLSVGNTVSAVTLSSDATSINAALDVTTTGMTQYRSVSLMSNTTSGFLGIGAEL